MDQQNGVKNSEKNNNNDKVSKLIFFCGYLITLPISR